MRWECDAGRMRCTCDMNRVRVEVMRALGGRIRHVRIANAREKTRKDARAQAMMQ